MINPSHCYALGLTLITYHFSVLGLMHLHQQVKCSKDGWSWFVGGKWIGGPLWGEWSRCWLGLQGILKTNLHIAMTWPYKIWPVERGCKYNPIFTVHISLDIYMNMWCSNSFEQRILQSQIIKLASRRKIIIIWFVYTLASVSFFQLKGTFILSSKWISEMSWNFLCFHLPSWKSYY